jgi:hypothetical protein
VQYQRNWVLAAYRAEHDNRRNPSAQALDDFDQTLFETFENEIQKQADVSIPLNLFNRSILMYFASRSDTVAPATQVRHAYEFFRNTQPAP